MRVEPPLLVPYGLMVTYDVHKKCWRQGTSLFVSFAALACPLREDYKRSTKKKCVETPKTFLTREKKSVVVSKNRTDGLITVKNIHCCSHEMQKQKGGPHTVTTTRQAASPSL
jgi:hypothetical protein